MSSWLCLYVHKEVVKFTITMGKYDSRVRYRFPSLLRLVNALRFATSRVFFMEQERSKAENKHMHK